MVGWIRSLQKWRVPDLICRLQNGTPCVFTETLRVDNDGQLCSIHSEYQGGALFKVLLCLLGGFLPLCDD